MMGIIRNAVREWLGIEAVVTVLERAEMKINPITMAEAEYGGRVAASPWKQPPVPEFFPEAARGHIKMAMDGVGTGGAGGFSIGQLYSWAANGAISEGIGFLGFPYLSELQQRPEYRRIVEIIAAEATRKRVKFSGNEERIDQIEKQLKRFKVWSVLREVVEHDGAFGGGHIYPDMGEQSAEELLAPFVLAAKVGKGTLQGFHTIEPLWVYPGEYESISPLRADFYKPKKWYVMADIVDRSRLITIVGRQVPDLLKAAYAFRGLSLTQMAKPYIDNWLRTRQSVSDLLHSFSTMVLYTNMNTVLLGKSAENFWKRLSLFTKARDNRGVMAVDYTTEKLENVSTPLGTLDKLLAQSQEQIASVTGIPLVILLGVTPSGLNASSDGEVRSFYATIKAYQERVLRDPLEVIIAMVQLDLDGKIDDEITFEFIDLWEMDEKAKAEIRKSDAEVDVSYTGAGVVSNEEVRKRIVQDEDSPYFGIDLSAPAPEDEETVFEALTGTTPDDSGSSGDEPAKGVPDL